MAMPLNFAHFLAFSLSACLPRGGRLDDRLLSEAFRAGLKEEAPEAHELADDAEALLAYGCSRAR